MASFLLAAVACAAVLPAVMAQSPEISSVAEVPAWAADSAMQLSLFTSGGEQLPLQYIVMPLTQSLGLNQSDLARGAIKIEGQMVAADQNTYTSITRPTQVAYLSCDTPSSESTVTPEVMLTTLMQARPKAIVLYTLAGNWCSLDETALPYQSIFTMTDSGDSQMALSFLNGTNEAEVVRVAITGNTTADGADVTANSVNGNNSAVAMSILYSITGLITMLFLVIIATGAIRAHRYPERYGPRSGYGGRPRQSRAKGIARAVLETIPIIKFGNPEPAKPDPAHELEEQMPIERPQTNAPRVTALEGQPKSDAVPRSTAEALPSVTTQANAKPSSESNPAGEEHLGCSICTDDFMVGEDVRVLPCSHKFHPGCIDPWLINVSGTCPLCRLDLRPQGKDGAAQSEGSTLPPPLDVDGHESDESSAHRHRVSRLFDLNRLRHASVEERIEVLRQYRTEQRDADGAGEVPDAERSRRARLADKLREKFRIRTRAQSPDHAPRQE